MPRLELDPTLVPDRCLTPEEIERAERNRKRTAFQDSPIPLGPFFWATRDRTLVQAMLVYWRYLGIKERTRLSLLFPLYLSHCAPDSEVFGGPLGLFGWRKDHQGTAGYWGPYLYRRDRHASSDVLFPIFWWLRDEQESTFLLLNTYSLVRGEDHNFGMVPFYFGHRGRYQSYFDITPVFARWGDRGQDNWWTLQTWWHSTPDKWALRSPPFYLGGEDIGGNYHHLVPAALTFLWGDQESHNKIIGPYFSRTSPSGWDRGIAPLFIAGETDGGETAATMLVNATLDSVGGPLGFELLPETGQPFHYFGIPLLFAWYWADQDKQRLWALQSYWLNSDQGYSFGSIPFYFRGRQKDGSWYDIAPLALNAHWGDSVRTRHIIGPYYYWSDDNSVDLGLLPLFVTGHSADDHYFFTPLGAQWGDTDGEQNLWLLQTLAFWDAAGWSIYSPPFFFGSDNDQGEHHLIIPPLLFAHYGQSVPDKPELGDSESLTVAGPYFHQKTSGGHDTGLFPLFLRGRAEQRDPPFLGELVRESFNESPVRANLTSPFSRPYEYLLIPPLLYTHVQDQQHQFTWCLQSYTLRSTKGYDFASLPFYFRGRHNNGAYYDIAPPALFANWGDNKNSHTYVLQTYYQRQVEGWKLWSVPFYFAGAQPGKAAQPHYTIIPPLLYAHWGDQTSQQTLVLQTFYQEGPDSYRLWSPPLFFAGATKSTNETSDYLIIPPLAFATWGDSHTSHTIALQTYYEKTQQSYKLWSIPFYFAGASQDQRHPYHYQVIPPLLFARWGDQHIDRTWVAQTYYQSTADTWQLWSIPFYFGGEDHTDPQSPYYHIVPPLLFARWGDQRVQRTWVAQTYHQSTADTWQLWSVPFYFAGADNSAQNPFHYQVIPPLLFARWGNKTDTQMFVGPYYNLETQKGRDFGLLPIYLSGESFAQKEKATHDKPQQTEPSPLAKLSRDYALAPVVGKTAAHELISDNGFHYWMVPPLLSLHVGNGEDNDLTWIGQTYLRQQQQSWHFGTFPFYFGGEQWPNSNPGTKEAKRPDSYYHFVPLTLTALWGDATRDQTVVGPWFDFQERTKHGQNRDWGLLPLVLGGSTPNSSYLVGPGFGHWANPDKSQDLWILQTWFFGSEGGWTLDSIPFYFGRHRDSGDYYDIVPPALFARWGDQHESNLWVLQTYHHSDNQGWNTSSVPFYFGGESYDKKGAVDAFHHIIPPLLYAHFGSQQQDNRIVGPYFHWQSKQRYDLGVFPFYFRGRGQAGNYYDIAPPLLFGRWGDQQESNFWLAQTYVHQAPWGWNTTSIPFYFGGETLDRGQVDSFYHIVPPLLYMHLGDQQGEQKIAGPYYKWSDRRGYDMGVLPFYFRGRSGDAYYDTIPLLLYSSWGNDHERNLWIAQTRYHKGPNSWMLWTLPFYAGEETANGDYYHFVPPALTLLYGNDKKQTHTSFIVPPAYIHWQNPDEETTLALLWYQSDNHRTGAWARAFAPFWFAGREGRSHYSVVPPFYASFGDGKQETDFLLGWFSRQYYNGDFVRGFLPAYYESQTDDAFLRMYSPAFWQWGEKESTRTLVPPLLAYGSQVGDESFFIAPMVWHSSDTVNSDTVVFPFYWHFGSKKFDATVVSGVWWDFKWPLEDKNLRIAPLYLNWEDREESFHIAGPISWSKGKGEHQKAWSFHVMPFASVWSYHPDHIKWRALLVVAGYEREYEKRQYMIFGVKTEPE